MNNDVIRVGAGSRICSYKGGEVSVACPRTGARVNLKLLKLKELTSEKRVARRAQVHGT